MITTEPPTGQAIYYFEIPVDAGEYALGSYGTNDYKGSCALLYLDIGASGNDGGGNSGSESGSELTMSVTADKYYYPKGVDFLAGETGLDNIQNSAAIFLPQGVGSVGFSRTGDVITVTSAGELHATYIKDGITLRDYSGNTITISPSESETVYLKKTVQTTDGVTTVSIYRGADADKITNLIFTYTYADSGTANITTEVAMEDNIWVLEITSDVTLQVTEIGSRVFIIKINGTEVKQTGEYTP